MKKLLLILLVVTATIIYAEIGHSNKKPAMFYEHQGSRYFVTNIVSHGDTAYSYQTVKIESITKEAVGQALLDDYESYKSVPFTQYYNRSNQRAQYAFDGTIDLGKAALCGYEEGITENAMKELLGVIHYAD